MVVDSSYYHLHKRKRIHEKNEPYPHPIKWKRWLDKIIYVVAVVGPLFTLPQVLKIWFGKDVSGVSIITWSAFLLLSFIWLVYGIAHKEKPIIFANILWILLHLFIVVGIILYG